MDQFVSFMNYYPKYEYLDNILSTSGATKVNIFLDLKGNINSLYMKENIDYIINQTKGAKYIDNSLFSSVMEFITFHKLYAKKRSVDLNMFFFYDTGMSLYHTEIFKDYKEGRNRNADVVLPNGMVLQQNGIIRKARSYLETIPPKDSELFRHTLNQNYEMINNIGNKIPNVSIIHLKFLEADFVPYHVRKYILGPFQPKEIDVIYSTDKDMLQCLDNPNTYIFYKHYKNHKIIDAKNAYSHFFKKEWTHIDIGLEWFPLVLSILGDASDEFKGVSYFGIVSIYDNIREIIKLTGSSVDELYKKVQSQSDIFNKDIGTNIKNITKLFDNQPIISRNLKLSSYKLLSEYINSGFPFEKTTKFHRHIEQVVNNKEKISNGLVLLSALNKAGLGSNIAESTILNLFK